MEQNTIIATQELTWKNSNTGEKITTIVKRQQEKAQYEKFYNTKVSHKHPTLFKTNI